MTKNLMIQGTASSAGKSVMVAGICRILQRQGLSAAPFKAQNMALNSYVTAEGKEMGRAQVFQAEAAGLEPDVSMNPVLLKPSGDKGSQVIVNGEPRKHMKAGAYYEFKPQLKGIVKRAYDQLASQHDVIVIEGAGSPAEINLQENDIVNMGMAEMVSAPVILVGDIERGGVFASLYGTVKLLPPEDQNRIKALLINKFRGDKKLLEPGLQELEEKLGIPFLGVLPYIELALDDEDSLSERLQNKVDAPKNEEALHVNVVLLPHISNFTDFNPLEMYEGINVNYIKSPEQVAEADVLILPGSKNTLEDRVWLRQTGFDQAIKNYAESGKLLIGVCGGFQMLGSELSDPRGTESNMRRIPGLDLLPIKTVMAADKKTLQATGSWQYEDDRFFAGMKGLEINGYEIHMGRTELLKSDLYQPVNSNADSNRRDGDQYLNSIINSSGNILGTYWHGIFENRELTTRLINNLRGDLGRDSIASPRMDYQQLKEQEYNRLADMLEAEMDMEMLAEIVGLDLS